MAGTLTHDNLVLTGDASLTIDGKMVKLGAGADGQLYSSSDNLYIDNATADKDILIRCNDNTTMRTAIQVNGTEGSVTMPRQSFVFATLSTGQTITHNTVTTLLFDTVGKDVLTEYSSVTGIFTAKHAGVYNVAVNVQWKDTNNAINYNCYLVLTGTGAFGDAGNLLNAPAHGYFPVVRAGNVYIPAGGTIKIQVYQYSGGNEMVSGSDVLPGCTALGIAKIA